MSKIKVNNDQIVAFLKERQRELTTQLDQLALALTALSTLDEGDGSKASKHLIKAGKIIQKSNKVKFSKEKAKAAKLLAATEKKAKKATKASAAAAKKAPITAEIKVTPARVVKSNRRLSGTKQAILAKPSAAKTATAPVLSGIE